MKAAAGESGASGAFPWREVMAAGLGLLRLSSKTFWSMTPREFEAAIGAFTTGREKPLQRDELAELMLAFPDRKAGRGD